MESDIKTKKDLDSLYNVESFRGCGGFGTVHINVIKLEHANKNFRERMAVKSIENDESARREIGILNRLKDDPQVVTMVGSMVGSPYYIFMECLNADLATFMEKRKFVISLEDFFKICEDMLNCLKTLEEKGILHRDVKPRNFLVDFRGSDGSNVQLVTLKIADFGSARQLNMDKMRKGELGEITKNHGTPGYMSPEISLLQDSDDYTGVYDTMVDMWGLGASALYCASGGQKPFSKEYLIELDTDFNSDQKRNDSIESKVKKYVKESLSSMSSIIIEALKWNPKDRIDSTKGLILIQHLKKYPQPAPQKRYELANLQVDMTKAKRFRPSVPNEGNVKKILGHEEYDTIVDFCNSNSIKIFTLLQLAKTLDTSGNLHEEMKEKVELHPEYSNDIDCRMLLSLWYKTSGSSVSLKRIINGLKNPDVSLGGLAMELSKISLRHETGEGKSTFATEKAELKNQQKEELEQALGEERKTFEVKLETEKAEFEKGKKELENRLIEERKAYEVKVTAEKAQLEKALVKEREIFEQSKLKAKQDRDEERKQNWDQKLRDKHELEKQMNEERQKFQKDLQDRSKNEMKKNMEIERFKIKESMKKEFDQLEIKVLTKEHEIEKLKMTETKLTEDLKEEKRKNEELRKQLQLKEDTHQQNLDKAKEEKLLDERKKVEQEKVKIEQLQKKVFESENDFRDSYPSLFSKTEIDKAPGLILVGHLTKSSDAKLRVTKTQFEVNIPLIKKEEIKNRTNGIAARMFKTQYPKDMVPKGSRWLTKLPEYFSGPKNETRMKKTLMLLGLTGTGKTTFIDAFVNYIFDIRYEDSNRLRLIEMTRDEKLKKDSQAQSQTDHIVVYQIEAIPDMKIFFDLTIIDTPGFGDTRGIEYDKKLMQNIEDLFKSKKIDSLDAIGFVAKAGDARLTAQQKYIFESILHIFGKDVEQNLLSILTCYDGMKVNILYSFQEANMSFVSHIPVNSEAIFQHNDSEPVTRKTLEKNPSCVNFHEFFKSSKLLVETIVNMKPKSLDLTVQVLADREHIEVEMQGLHHHVKELLIKKDMIAQETDICNRHKENANATADTEYEVEEQNIKKVELPYGTYVTNCVVCNRTCHYPCGIPNDNGKSGCAAMGRGTNPNKNDPSPQDRMCSVCPKKCHWSKHVNNPHKIEFELKKLKKTYDEIVKRHNEFIGKHKGQKTVIDALKDEAEGISKVIQGNIQKIMVCLHNLKQNVLSPDSSSSSDYIDEMISAEKHEKKPGYLARIKQLREEKDKADYFTKIQAGADPDSL